MAGAREGIASWAVEIEGNPGRTVAEALGVTAPSIYRTAQRGRAAHTQWHRLIAEKR